MKKYQKPDATLISLEATEIVMDDLSVGWEEDDPFGES